MRTTFIAVALLLGACGRPEQPPAPAASVATASTAASPAAPAEAAQPATMARFDGYGEMRFGMDEAAFAAAWGGELNGTPQPGSSCYARRPRWVKQPSDFSFMFEHGRFVRYDVGTAKETAPGGGKVGMDTSRIRALYGERVRTQPHKYVAGASYLRIAGPQGSNALVFETDAQGKVIRWHVGVPPQVDYVEGCG